jgi:hypothetical protein
MVTEWRERLALVLVASGRFPMTRRLPGSFRTHYLIADQIGITVHLAIPDKCATFYPFATPGNPNLTPFLGQAKVARSLRVRALKIEE